MKRRRYPDRINEIQKLVLRIYDCRQTGQFEKAKLLDNKLAKIQRIENKKPKPYG